MVEGPMLARDGIDRACKDHQVGEASRQAVRRLIERDDPIAGCEQRRHEATELPRMPTETMAEQYGWASSPLVHGQLVPSRLQLRMSYESALHVRDATGTGTRWKPDAMRNPCRRCASS